MKADAATETDFSRRIRGFFAYRPETGGPSVAALAAVALLSFIAQIIFHHNMALGEFGTVNTALGIVGMMSVPLLALNQAFTLYLARNHPAERTEYITALRSIVVPAMELFAWTWGAICLPLLFLVLAPLLHLPRFSILFFTLLVIFISLGSLLSAAISQSSGSWWRWGWLLIAAGVARVCLGAELTGHAPWTESALAVFLIAGLITLGPALFRPEAEPVPTIRIWRAVRDRDFLIFLGATFSVTLALFLFSSGDRIVAQSWFGTTTDNNLGYVNWDAFDSYQTAGLLGRALLWGTQPLLWILFAQRQLLSRTTAASLKFFWIYLTVLILGVIFLIVAKDPLSRLFCGEKFQETAALVPIFALAMFPLGLLQGLGIFALASRRYHECFVLGGCAIGYTLVLYLAGRQPGLMAAYMFGGGLVALMVVLFVSVVRWGRKQP